MTDWSVEHYQLKNVFTLVGPDGFKFSVSGLHGLLGLLESLSYRGTVIANFHSETYYITPNGELRAIVVDPWENPNLKFGDEPTNVVFLAKAARNAIEKYLESKNVSLF